jgi:hypothetical protein
MMIRDLVVVRVVVFDRGTKFFIPLLRFPDGRREVPTTY